MKQMPQLTILFDNYCGLPGLKNLWGFAILIEMDERKILFDTGSNGRVLLQNMAILNIPADDIELIFLSHPHWDHIGGIDSIVELNPTATVVVHEGFSRYLTEDLATLCSEVVTIGTKPVPLAPGIFSTGMINSDTAEQALVLDNGEVTATISGCAHPGMDTMVGLATAMRDKPIDWAIGGFHLMTADEAKILETIDNLEKLGVDSVVPTHCTGDTAIEAFKLAWGERCFHGGVGTKITLEGRGR